MALRLLTACLILVVGAACTSAPTDAPTTTSDGETSAAKGPCPPTANLRATTPSDEPAALATAETLLAAITSTTYEPHRAWRLLDPWYRQEMGWESVGDFVSSDAGDPRTYMGRMDVANRAESFSQVNHVNRSFLFARMGAFGCSAADRRGLVTSLWYVSYVPRGGNAQGYVVVVGRASGFRVVHVD